MLSLTKKIVLNVEYNVSSVSLLRPSGYEVVLLGVIDYTVVVTNTKTACELCLYLLALFSFLTKYRIHPEPSWGTGILPNILSQCWDFSVVEAKDRDVKLDDHVLQVLNKTVYAAATKLECGFPSSFSHSTELMIGQESSYTGYIEQTFTNGSFLCSISNQMAKEDFRSFIYSAAPQETSVNIDMVISENGIGH